MFYAHFVLAKKGPLARIWLAAHWDKKLTKAHVFETNIESSVEGILQPKVKMALRTSGHLLLGIVRIYSRKAKYLLADCNEAFIKIKIAFRPGVVDLPEGNREAAVAAITLPEVFHDFDTAMPDITIDMDAQVSLNQSRAEDITLKEDYGSLCLVADDGFDDLGFDEPEGARDAATLEDFDQDQATLLLGEDEQMDVTIPIENSAQANTSANISIPPKANLSLDAPVRDDGFGGTIGEGLLDGETGALFEPAGLFDEAPLGPIPVSEPPAPDAEPSTSQILHEEALPPEKPLQEPVPEDESDDDDMYDMAPGSIGAPSPPSSPESPGPPEAPDQPVPSTSTEMPPPETEVELTPPESEPPILRPPSPPQNFQDCSVPHIPAEPVPPTPALEHTTLINNDAESFALAPLDATVVHGVERTVKTKRKRKLIVDEVKSISGEEMKTQLSDTSDIVATLDLAPPTKRLMHWKETGGVEKLFALPGHHILSKTLSRGYSRHLTTRSVDNEDFFKDDSDTDIEQGRDEDVSVTGPRKRRRMSDRLNSGDLLPLDSLHLDTTRPSYPNDASMSHPSIDVSNFFEPQHPLFPPVQQVPDHSQQQMLAQQEQDQMMQQMLQNELPELPHIPNIMDSMVPDSLAPDVSLPEPISQPPSSIQQSDIAHSLLETFQEQQQPQENSCMENHINEPSFPETQTLQNPIVEDETTQNCPESQYLLESQSAAPVETPVPAPPPAVEAEIPPPAPVPEPPIEEVPSTSRQAESNDLFDALISDYVPPPPPEPPVENHVDDEVQPNKNNEYAMSEDDDDYGGPASVGPHHVPEEQQADETYEQFEERILTKRTTHLLHCIHNRLESHQKVNFGDLVRNNKRKQVAQKFYTFLVLKKQQAVELEQSSTYGDLIITKGPRYNLAYSGN